MTNSQRLAKVRTRFLNWMLDVHHDQSTADSNRPLIRRESMLIRDEFFCGRRFHSDQYDAIWFIEEDVLKIFRTDGTLAQTLRGAEIDAAEVNEFGIAASDAVAGAKRSESLRQEDPHEIALHAGSEPESQPSGGSDDSCILKLHDPSTVPDAQRDQTAAEDQAAVGNHDEGETRRAA